MLLLFKEKRGYLFDEREKEATKECDHLLLLYFYLRNRMYLEEKITSCVTYTANNVVIIRGCKLDKNSHKWQILFEMRPYSQVEHAQSETTVYGEKRRHMEVVHRICIRTPYTKLYDCRIRSYMVTVCVTFQIHTGSEWIYKQ